MDFMEMMKQQDIPANSENNRRKKECEKEGHEWMVRMNVPGVVFYECRRCGKKKKGEDIKKEQEIQKQFEQHNLLLTIGLAGKPYYSCIDCGYGYIPK